MTASEIAEALRCGRDGCDCGRAVGDEYKAHCPAHSDAHPSLSVTEKDGTVLVACHAGCSQDDIVGELRDRGLWSGGTAGSGVTLAELAEAKGLSVSFLRDLGWQDSKWSDKPSINIPYFTSDGTTLFIRRRIRLAAPDHYRQPKGVKLSAYGMNKLGDARKTNSILLVEGETDSATAWQNGFACLSIPGANAWKPSYTGLVERVESIFIIKEPGDAGEKMVEAIGASLPAAKVIELASEVKDLNGLWLSVDGDRAQFRARLKAAMAAATPISEIKFGKVREEAAAALTAAAGVSDNVLRALGDAIAKAGYAGDVQPAVLTWVAQVSRLLEKPLNLCFVSQSAAGKNHTIDAGLAFAHPDGYYSCKASSPRALIYNDEDFEHRMIVMAEADSIPDDSPAASAVRSLIEDSEMSYEVVEKDDSGRHAVRRIVKPGPTGLITTAIKPLAEQMWTRVLEIGISDTPSQTRKVLEAHAISVNGDRPMPEAAPFIALDRWLELAGERRVTIPFAGALAKAVPDKMVRMRRDFRQLLTVIQAIAMIHQGQRERDGADRIIATADDYENARWLLEDVFTATATGGVSAAVREAVLAVKALFNTTTKAPVYVRAVSHRLKLSRDAAWKRVQRAVDLGYLVNQETRKGQPALLVLGDDLPEKKSALPEKLPGLSDSVPRRARRRALKSDDTDTKSANNEGVHARTPSVSGHSTPPTPVTKGGRGVSSHRKAEARRRAQQESPSVPVSEGAHALPHALPERTLPEPTYRRGSTEATGMFHLAEARAWPAVSLGEWVIAGKTVRVTVAGTRMAWEEAAAELPVELAAEVVKRLESMPT